MFFLFGISSMIDCSLYLLIFQQLLSILSYKFSFFFASAILDKFFFFIALKTILQFGAPIFFFAVIYLYVHTILSFYFHSLDIFLLRTFQIRFYRVKGEPSVCYVYHRSSFLSVEKLTVLILVSSLFTKYFNMYWIKTKIKWKFSFTVIELYFFTSKIRKLNCESSTDYCKKIRCQLSI